MAEERDPLTTPDTGYATGGSASGAYAAREKDPEDIERDIRETRAEMSETLDAIGARFRPDYIKEQAKDALRSTARDAGTTMLDTIKANPIPSLIAGLSIGWLIAKGGQQARDQEWGRGDGYYGRPDYDRYRGYDARYRGYGEPYGYGRYDTGYGAEGDYGDRSLKGKASDAASHAREKAGDLAHEARERVGDLAHQATDQVQELGHQAQRVGRQATNWLEHQMYENPLAVGAVALAAGAFVGLAVPNTETEDQLMGRASERLTEKVKDVAEEKADQVKAVAREAAGEVKEKAREVVDTAKEEAKNQGLTSGGGSSQNKGGSTGGASGVSGLSGGTTQGSTVGASTTGGSTTGGSGATGTPTSGATSGTTGTTGGQSGGNR
jgi:ElaB/YqjD/DUF883 family membrane-anchored ribosome-binding protein